eukprot:TRINITY_DN9812_c0_g2_i1.p1 TRINITY_DN9812_c0_g2~~TRINITY_DN9812_c0_g2_i1.p1  ORF type:complete len:198 (-),score=44.25 TRINITY_DN9812_c0_g2_i1:1140-1733(-)
MNQVFDTKERVFYRNQLHLVCQDKLPEEVREEICSFVAAGFAVGGYADVYDKMYQVWCVGLITAIDHKTTAPTASIHWIGWSLRYDLAVSLNDETKIAEAFTKTKPKDKLANPGTFVSYCVALTWSMPNELYSIGYSRGQVHHFFTRYSVAEKQALAVNYLIYFQVNKDAIYDETIPKDVRDFYLESLQAQDDECHH